MHACVRMYMHARVCMRACTCACLRSLLHTSLVAQVGSDIVHFFMAPDPKTGEQTQIYATGTISKIPKRGGRGKRWVEYDDGEFDHGLLPEHHGRLWSFIEWDTDFEFGAPLRGAVSSYANSGSDSDSEEDTPLNARRKVGRLYSPSYLPSYLPSYFVHTAPTRIVTHLPLLSSAGCGRSRRPRLQGGGPHLLVPQPLSGGWRVGRARGPVRVG